MNRKGVLYLFSEKKDMSEHGWFVLLMLIVCVPIGLYLLYRNKNFNKIFRIVLYFLFGIYFSFWVMFWTFVIFGYEDDESSNKKEPLSSEIVEDREEKEMSIVDIEAEKSDNVIDVRDELVEYSKRLEKLVPLENEATALQEDIIAMEGISHDNRAELLTNELLPLYKRLLSESGEFEIKNDELRKAHEKIIEAHTLRYSVVLLMIDALQSNDFSKTVELNEKVAEANKASREYSQMIEDLVEKYSDK